MYIISWDHGYEEVVGDCQSITKIAKLLERNKTEFKVSTKMGYLPQWEFGVASPGNKPDAPSMPPLSDYLRGNMNQQFVTNPAVVHTSYIPTPFIVPPEIKVGENWYVKNYIVGNRSSVPLREIEVLDVTKNTVLIREIHEDGYEPDAYRFKKSDIEFVEKVEEKV